MQRFTQDVGGMIGLKSSCAVIIGLGTVAASADLEEGIEPSPIAGGDCYITIEQGLACSDNAPDAPDNAIGSYDVILNQEITTAETNAFGQEETQQAWAICMLSWDVDTDDDGEADDTVTRAEESIGAEATGAACGTDDIA